ncbi:MAG: efflux RND transporter periplasmic adaptor subunit [Sphingomonadales bacterium]|nr:efflux RND transporter periplasmic adaptor subunit [Sphingomonadales bacterium]
MNVEPDFARENAESLEAAETANRRSRRLRAIIIGVVALVAAILVAFLLMRGGAGENAGVAGAPEQSLPTVTVMVPGSQNISSVISATGTLAARREMPVGVAGEGGQVIRVYVDAGDWVGAGQTLASIESSVQNRQTQSARANVEVARSDLALAQAELDRALQLVERGFISQADIDRKTATRDAARARVNVAQAQLGELQARAGRLAIRAPAAGLILERMVEPGQVVSAGSGALFRMARGGEMEMNAGVSEDELVKLSVGQRAIVRPVGAGQSFEGQIWQLSPVIDQQTRQGTASIALSYDRALRPGGFAQARIMSGSVDAPLLPESAVLSDDSGSFVYIIDENNTVVRRDVEIGNVSNEGITIRSGLQGNERVVVSAGAFLNPGDEVIPQRVARDEAS